MGDADCYAVARDVIHETFEGEVIIANLQGGSYYTLGGVGLDVWTALAAGVPVGAVVAAIAEAFGRDAQEVADTVAHLVARLTDEHLLTGPTPAAPGAATEVVVTADTFEEPTFERYTDMQQLLLLDPIHDVDDSGWPAP